MLSPFHQNNTLFIIPHCGNNDTLFMKRVVIMEFHYTSIIGNLKLKITKMAENAETRIFCTWPNAKAFTNFETFGLIICITFIYPIGLQNYMYTGIAWPKSRVFNWLNHQYSMVATFFTEFLIYNCYKKIFKTVFHWNLCAESLTDLSKKVQHYNNVFGSHNFFSVSFKSIHSLILPHMKHRYIENQNVKTKNLIFKEIAKQNLARQNNNMPIIIVWSTH